MDKLALAKLLCVLAGSVLLTLFLLFLKHRVEKNTEVPQPDSRMKTLLQSLVLVTLSALAANLILRPVDAEGLRSFAPDAADALIRHAKKIHLLGFIGLTALFCLIIGAVVFSFRNRKSPVRQWLYTASEKQKPVSFGKAESQAIKGIAILAMLFYHLFCSGRADGFPISYFPFTKELMDHHVQIFKLCVPMFAFVSGYGLFLSFCKKQQLSDEKWVLLRYIKTFSGFWFVFVLSVLILQVIKGRFVASYYEGDIWVCALSVVIDFLGLANLFGTPTFLGTWWYMSAAFVFILLTPLFCGGEGKYLPLWLIGSIVFIRLISGGHGSEVYVEYFGGTTAYVFLAAFLTGAVLARNDLLVRIVNAPGRPIRLITGVILLIIAYKVYKHAPLKYYWELKWALIPALGILYCVEFVIRIPILKQVLQFLGRHSMNMYLIHNFFRGYMKEFFYGQKHFMLSFFLLVCISLVASILIEALKKVLRYDESINKLCGRIANKPRQEITEVLKTGPKS